MEGKLTKSLGVETEIFDCGWEKRKNFEEIEERLNKKIDAVEGEVVLIGISAGMVASLIAKNKYGDKIPKIVSICGWSRPKIKLDELERKKFWYLAKTNHIFKEGVEKYTKIYKNILQKDWENIMVFWAENDVFVPKSCCVHKGMRATELKIVEHVGGILLGLTKTKEIREFIEAE
jgi:predicted peptidase